ncbi:MAG: c-type cytochrome [Phycisphaerae bacterium]|nr:c-type cytochrome [Phycisphaerae bacterium]
MANQTPTPTAPREPVLLSSNYDGIREYDNPMPFWWTSIFWLTILAAGPYFFFYHLGVGSSLNDNYEAEVGEYGAILAAQLGDVEADTPTILTLVERPELRMGGAALFKGNCATCHGPEGGGLTGPNLTDDAYINVKTPEDIFRVITNGVPGKGMPEWGKRFSKQQVLLLASYVANLRGTKPGSAKEAQGSVIEPWPKVEAPATPSGSAAPTK